MFTRKYIKQGHLLIRHAEKLVRYRRDVLSESAIGDFKLQVEALRQSLKDRDEAKTKEESDRLHDLYTQYLPAPKDAVWRENVEVILVAVVVAIGWALVLLAVSAAIFAAGTILSGRLYLAGWIQAVPRRIVDGNVEQREERGERRPERVIERLQRVHHPLAPQFDVCPLLDPEISLE